jgi:hypothetical protein
MPRVFKTHDLKKLLKSQSSPQKPGQKTAQKPPQQKEDSLSQTLQQLLKHGRRIREKKMNKTEKTFSLLLEEAKKNGEILKWHFEEITLKLAPNTRYTPDFLAVLPCGAWHIFEIKGHLEDDAAVKFKTACEKFPEITFQMVKKKKGAWQTLFKIPSKIRAKTLLQIPKEKRGNPPKDTTQDNLTKNLKKPKKKK